jgi:formylglycine-generating enzyme required for sulfatase activity
MSDPAVARAAEAIWFRHLSREAGGASTGFEQLCAAHPRLAGELERLKDDWERTSGARVAPDGALRPFAPGEVSSALARLEQLRPQVSKYEVRGELGRGGMGVVQRVWDASLRRELARKTMHRSLGPARAQTLARFLEEAQILAQLDHPAIVPIHDLGLDEHDRPFFVMKLVIGRDLGAVYELAREGREGWTATRAVAVLLRVCEAVGYAHSKGVVHRDLKPSNVMVGTLGEVYVMDWGIARVSHAANAANAASIETVRSAAPVNDGPDSLHTGHGDVIGTAAYMAPEQARGEIEKLTARCDVYALGAMLYHLFAGRAPYSRPGTASRAVLLALLAGPPPPLDEVAPIAPEELAAICAKCMAREPEQRYADLVEVANELRAYLEGRVVRAHRTGAWTEFVKWVRRNRALAAVSTAAVLATTTGAALLAWKVSELRVVSAELGTLADSAEFDELIEAAHGLWPPRPERLAAYDSWLARARGLVDGSAPKTLEAGAMSAGLASYRERLARTRERAKPLSAEERERDRREHPKWSEYERKSRELEWRRRMAGLQPWPDEALVELELRERFDGADCAGLLRIAREKLGPDNRNYGQEVHALVAARRALEKAAHHELGLAHGCMSMALCKVGRLDEAELHARSASEHGGSSEFPALESMLRTIASWRGEQAPAARRDALAAELERLALQVNERRTYHFDDPTLEFWHGRYSEAVSNFESLASHLHGDSEGAASPQLDWSVAGRRAWVVELLEETIEGPAARERWAQALRDVKASPEYRGLELRPQFGLLPLGPDPQSGLWEFAHLLSGEAPSRDTEGRLELTPETGIVLVLLPGGEFWMGAQSADPAAPNFDEGADEDEAPPHRVALAPFFAAKYETTVGQWMRITGATDKPTGFAAQSELTPVAHVSWQQCSAALPRLDLSLPTEAQWEYAARAGVSSPHSLSANQPLAECANLYEQTAVAHGVGSNSPAEAWRDGHPVAAKVGSLAGNAFGLHDVHGNVFEWCLDEFGSYRNEVREGDGLRLGRELPDRVLRGGAYSSDAWLSRSSLRHRAAVNYSYDDVGFRAVRALEP